MWVGFLSSGMDVSLRRTEQLDWAGYLENFHRSRPGITEDILARSKSGGTTPYDWLCELVPRASLILDIACGSGPLLDGGRQRSWIGIDRSSSELELAKTRAHGRLMRADAAALPFAAGSVGTVACSMALMLLEPLAECLAEVSRVLVSGGSLVLLVPGGPSGLSGQDVVRWAHLLLALRVTRLRYPNGAALESLARYLDPDMVIAADEDRRFGHIFEDEAATDRFVDSLYLGHVSPSRIAAAKRVARRWVGRELGIPLRRVHIEKLAR
jgi:SAM-dependent methyltransferase